MRSGIDWALDWPAGSVVVACLVAAIIVAVSWLGSARLADTRKRVALLALRVFAVGTVVVALMQPVWIAIKPAAGGRAVAVLVDTSASMARGERSRLNRAKAAIAGLRKSHGVRVFSFSADVQPIAADALESVKADGKKTDVMSALEGLQDVAATGEVGAIVVISDGIDHGRLGAAKLDSNGELPPQLRRVVASLGVPVHVAGPREETLADAAITEIGVSPFGYVRSQLPVTVDLRLRGFESRPGNATVELLRGGRVVQRTSIPLVGPPRRRVAMHVQPLLVGDDVVSARIVPLPGEATVSNNIAHKRVRILRDRTRVLHLAGHPSWDTRFLRSHLRSDRSVDLVSFYIMVAQGAGYFVRAADTTLIEFPTRQLFQEALSDFDLVIFQDFQFTRFGIDAYLPGLQRYVRDGGAFAVIGGQQAFAAGGYERTQLSNWLPVAMANPGAGAPLYSEKTTELRLSQTGATHPVTRLRTSPSDNAAAWRRLELPGRNTGLSGRSGAQVLLLGDNDAPLLTVAEHGKGRVAAFATAGAWTWAFGPHSDDRAQLRADYHAFIDRLRKWLTQDPELSTIRFDDIAVSPVVGTGSGMTARIFDAGDRPTPGAVCRWRRAAIPDRPGPWQAIAQTSDATGRVAWSWVPPHGGVFEINLRCQAGTRDERATTTVAVHSASLEERDVQPDTARLAAVAAAGGGRYYNVEAPLRRLQLSLDEASERVQRVRTELWSHPIVGFLLVLLLAAEWALRRRWGLA